MSVRCFLIVILLNAMLTSCGRKAAEDKRTVFRYNESSGISSLDPAFARDQAMIWASNQLFNGLVQLDSNLNVQPCISSSWTISTSGADYTFRLKQHILFHKNSLFGSDSTRAVKASDFVFSFNRILDEKLSSPGRWIFNAVRDSLPFEAPDDSTFIIHLQKPFPPFISLLSTPYASVVPKEVVNYYGADFRSHPCGTGPFKFSFWKEGVRLVLLKNENYFEIDNGQRLPFLDAVMVSFINDKQSAFLEFLKGNLDFISGLDASYKDDLLTRSGQLKEKYKNKFTLISRPYLNTEYLGILMDDVGPLTNKKVRQALSYAVDRTSIVGYLRNNIGTPGIYGMIPPGIPSFDTTVAGYHYDREKARKLLTEAGYPNGKGLPEISLSMTSAYQDLAEFIKSRWEDIGVKARIDINQAAVHRKMVSEQKLPFFRGSWIADYPDAENYLSLFYSKNFAPAGPNYTHFKSDEYDKLYQQAEIETNDSLRYIIYRKMDQLVINEAPVIILFYDKVLRLVSEDISGMETNAMNLLQLKRVKRVRS